MQYIHLLSPSVTFIPFIRRRSTRGTCWFTQHRATQAIHRQTPSSLGESTAKRMPVCERNMGTGPRTRSAVRLGFAPIFLPRSWPWRYLWGSSSQPWPYCMFRHLPELHFRKVASEYLTLGCASWQNQSCSSWPHSPPRSPVWAVILSGWLPLSSQNKGKLLLVKPSCENAFPGSVLWSGLKTGFGWGFKNFDKQGLLSRWALDQSYFW